MKTQLKKNEKIVFDTKPHRITLLGPIILSLIVIIGGISVGGYGLLVSLIFVLYFLYKIAERNNNLCVVTDLRVIIERGVFSSYSKESPLDKINNVTFDQSFAGRIFGYGNVQIQTAAEQGSTFEFSANDPKKLKDVISTMQEEYKKNQITSQAQELANAILKGQNNSKGDTASEIEKLFDLKQKGILTEEEFTKRKAKILES